MFQKHPDFAIIPLETRNQLNQIVELVYLEDQRTICCVERLLWIQWFANSDSKVLSIDIGISEIKSNLVD